VATSPFARRFTFLALAFAAAPAAAQTGAQTAAPASSAVAPAANDVATAPAAPPAASIGRAGERAGGDEAVRVVELPWEWLTAAPLPAPGEATVSMRPIMPGTFSWAAPAAATGSAAWVAGGTIGLAPGLGWVLQGAHVPGVGYGSMMLTGLEASFAPPGAPWFGTLSGGYFGGGAGGGGAWGGLAIGAEAGRWQGGFDLRGYAPFGGEASFVAATGAYYRVGGGLRLGAEAGAFAQGGRGVTPFVSPAIDARVGDKRVQVRLGPGGMSWRGSFLARYSGPTTRRGRSAAVHLAAEGGSTGGGRAPTTGRFRSRPTRDHGPVLRPAVLDGVRSVRYGFVHFGRATMVRGQPREDALLRATIELLGEVGYEALTVDAVAARARASKATIYRRWRNKAELVKAALDSLDAEHNAAIPDTGALRSDLVAVMAAVREKATGAYVAMINDLIVAARRDEALAAALKSHVENEALSPFQAVLCRAIERGRLPADAPAGLVHDVAEAMVLRRLQTGAPFDDAFIDKVVDGVLLPLLRRRKRKQT
jgi:AcrR family transcriptional regulator